MPRFHRLSVAAARPEAGDTLVVSFEVPPELAEAYRFLPGQHVTLRCVLDGEEVRRSYSICGGVDEGGLRIAVRRRPGGRFSAVAAERLRPGRAIDVMTPVGRFTTPLDPARRGRYVAFAAGSGIAPVISIARSVLAVEPLSRLALFYGNRTTGSIAFREALADLKDRHLGRFSLYHILSRETRETELFNGRIDGARVEALCRGLVRVGAVDAFFVCGPEAMIGEVTGALARQGVEPRRVRFELFDLNPGRAAAPPAGRARPAPAAGGGGGCRVAAILDGRRTEFGLPYGAGTILEAGRAAGVDLPFACRSGVCCTCRARLLEGEVDMAANHALDAAELAAGYILTCQSRPLTERLVVDYDAA